MKDDQSTPTPAEKRPQPARRTPKQVDQSPGQQRLPTVDELLHKLLHLNGAVALGAISTKDAHLIHKNLKAVLDVVLKRSSGEMTIRDEAALSQVVRDDPKLLNALAPFLSPHQLQLLLDQAMEADDDEDD